MKYAPIHGYYWVLPILTALVWFSTLVTLLGLWTHDHHRLYKPKEPNPVFISDIGAAHHKVFMGLAITTAGLYMITILTERYLRHKRRIPGSTKPISTWFDWACVFWTWVGCIGLILLSVFDAFHHSTTHWSMTVLFIVGVLLGVFFQACELYSLARSHRGESQEAFRTLLIIATVKVAILVVAIAVAIAFAALYRHCDGDASSTEHSDCKTKTAAASGCEWTVAFILFVYFFSYVADVWPARHRPSKHGVDEKEEVHASEDSYLSSSSQ